MTVSNQKQLPGAISTINPNFVIEGLAQELLFTLTQLPGEASERQRKLGEELVRFFAALPEDNPNYPPRIGGAS